MLWTPVAAFTVPGPQDVLKPGVDGVLSNLKDACLSALRLVEMLFIEALWIGTGTPAFRPFCLHLVPFDSDKFGYQFNKFESPTILPTSD